MPCSFCVKILSGAGHGIFTKSFFFRHFTGRPAVLSYRQTIPPGPVAAWRAKKGGFPVDRVYIIAIVAAIVLLAIHLIRDYGNRG